MEGGRRRENEAISKKRKVRWKQGRINNAEWEQGRDNNSNDVKEKGVKKGRVVRRENKVIS